MKACLALLVFGLAVGQTAAQGRGSLEGRVVTSADRAVPHARIVAAKIGGEIADYKTVVSDTDGRFTFPDLSAGRYRLYAQHDGFLPGEFGRRPVNTAGTPVVVADGRNLSDIVITMTQTGAIAGRVYDRGRPMAKVIVRALTARMINGERTLAVGTDWSETDDTGAYRLFGLAPGSYYVSAALDPSTFVPSYYPDTLDARAARAIEVRSGETTPSIDLTVIRTATYRVTAHLAGSIPEQAQTSGTQALAMSLLPVAGGQGRNSALPGVRSAADTFEVASVAPGSYYLQLSAQSRVCGFMPVSVTDQNVDITAVCQPLITVRGRATVDDQTAPALGAIQLLAIPGVRPGPSPGIIQPDGSFTIQNVYPGDYSFRFLPHAGSAALWIKSARFGSDDAMEGPVRVGSPVSRDLDIVFSAKTATIDALVVDGNRRPIPGALLVAVPAPALRNHPELFRTANADESGHARLTDIAPGEYRLFGTGEIEAARWQDPEVLRQYETLGEFVRLQEADTQSVTLRAVP